MRQNWEEMPCRLRKSAALALPVNRHLAEMSPTSHICLQEGTMKILLGGATSLNQHSRQEATVADQTGLCQRLRLAAHTPLWCT